MNSIQNPFEYEAANNLKPEDIIDYYIGEYNFLRFIQSTKNIFLIGERGSGKTMALRYNSFSIQHKIDKNIGNISYEKIGVLIPCNTPLFLKAEYMLIADEYKKAIICEHYLVLSILQAIASTLNDIAEIVAEANKQKDTLFHEIEYIWDVELDKQASNFFVAIENYTKKENYLTQKKINKFDSDAFYENTLSFASSVLPFLQLLRNNLDILSDSHFLLMVDDAQDMNEYQNKALNSWIAYRDHSLFSFKVATVKVDRPSLVTASGGCILEGHDFITVDMEQAYQNQEAGFYKLSKKIIEKRLQRIGLQQTAEAFFPINKSLEQDLESCKERTRLDGIKKYGEGNKKAINDFVYKYSRALYFKERKSKANTPPYSGFETIVDISTGVVRNLLTPCFWMFEKEISSSKREITSIPPKVQTEILIERSKDFWTVLKNGLDKKVNNCSIQDAKHINNLFDNLIALFAKRLMMDISEPRAIVFSISQQDIYPDQVKEIKRLLNIAQKATYIYTRLGNAKEKGKQETYYVPNRLLFPIAGLDPQGQASHASLKVSDLYNAAFNNKEIPIEHLCTENNNDNQLIIDYGD